MNKTSLRILSGVVFTTFLILILGWSMVSASSSAAETQDSVLYVKASANGNCSSWADACELQTALFNAVAGDQIWVAAGTYTPTTSTDRSATFQLKSGVVILGGFPADGGGLTDRDLVTNLTILSGDIGAVGTSGDNSYHVVTGSAVDGTAVLDGFSISGGNADGSDPNWKGGGMYNANGSPTLTNVTFSGNTADSGSGMYNDNSSSPTLTDVAFSSNFATYYGGGMVNYYYCSPSLTNVTFSGNSASYGGGMFNIQSNPTLTDVAFSSNFATYYGGGMDNYNNSSPTLTNVTLSDNSADYDGGGMYNNNSSPTLTNVTLSGNTAEYGGGMYNDNSSPTLTNVTFSGNTAEYGGGMYNGYISSPIVRNSILWGNTPDQVAGGAMSVTYSDIQDGYDGEGNIDANPLLGPLADNGGFTQTHALGFGSPAIDAGDENDCPAADQRGFPRPLDGNGDGLAVCDMGAYEYGIPLFFLPLILR